MEPCIKRVFKIVPGQPARNWKYHITKTKSELDRFLDQDGWYIAHDQDNLGTAVPESAI